jgi:hypothetical protein
MLNTMRRNFSTRCNAQSSSLGGASPRAPTYHDLNAAMDRVADLVQKYASLLNAEHLWGFEPAIQQDWKAPFRQPWIAE